MVNLELSSPIEVRRLGGDPSSGTDKLRHESVRELLCALQVYGPRTLQRHAAVQLTPLEMLMPAW